MWPWEAFNWGVFWAVLAAVSLALLVRRVLIGLDRLLFFEKAPLFPPDPLKPILEKLDAIEEAVRESKSEWNPPAAEPR